MNKAGMRALGCITLISVGLLLHGHVWAAPRLRFIEKHLFKSDVGRFRRATVEELRRSSRFSAEDLRRIEKYGAIGSPSRERAAFDLIKPHADDGFARLGNIKFVDDQVRSAAHKAMEDFALETAELNLKKSLGWNENIVELDPTTLVAGELERMYRTWGMILEKAKDNPVALFMREDRVFVHMHREGFELFGELRRANADHAKKFLRNLLEVKPGGTTDVFADRAAAKVLARLGISTEGWRVTFGFDDVVKVAEHVYVTRAADTSALAAIRKTALPAKRTIIVVGEPLPTDLVTVLKQNCKGCEVIVSTNTTQAELVEQIRARSGGLVTVVGHIAGETIGNAAVQVSRLRAAGIAHKTSTFVLGCNSIRFGTGVAGQVKLHPLLERISRALAGDDVETFLKAIATPDNPLVVDTPTITALKEVVTARTAVVSTEQKVLAIKRGSQSDKTAGATLRFERLRRKDGASPLLFAFVHLGKPGVVTETPPQQEPMPPPASHDAGFETATTPAPIRQPVAEHRPGKPRLILVGVVLVAFVVSGVVFATARKKRS